MRLARRVTRLTALVEELTAQRAEDRVGEELLVLVEEIDEDDGTPIGRAAHQGPDVDGVTRLPVAAAAIGELVAVRVVDAVGPDLVAVPLEPREGSG